MVCILSSWRHCHAIISCLLKSRIALSFWCRLTRLSWKKRPLNGCSISVTCHTYAASMKSICLSVTLVEQKVEWAHDRIVRCLGYPHAEADLDHIILWSLSSAEEDQWGMEKYGVFTLVACIQQCICRAVSACAWVSCYYFVVIGTSFQCTNTVGWQQGDPVHKSCAAYSQKFSLWTAKGR